MNRRSTFVRSASGPCTSSSLVPKRPARSSPSDVRVECFPEGEKMVKYAKGTTVSADRSLAEIRRLLQRYGADGFLPAEDWAGNRIAIEFSAYGRLIRFVLPLKKVDDFRTTARRAATHPGRGGERVGAGLPRAVPGACLVDQGQAGNRRVGHRHLRRRVSLADRRSGHRQDGCRSRLLATGVVLRRPARAVVVGGSGRGWVMCDEPIVKSFPSRFRRQTAHREDQTEQTITRS